MWMIPKRHPTTCTLRHSCWHNSTQKGASPAGRHAGTPCNPPLCKHAESQENDGQMGSRAWIRQCLHKRGGGGYIIAHPVCLGSRSCSGFRHCCRESKPRLQNGSGKPSTSPTFKMKRTGCNLRGLQMLLHGIAVTNDHTTFAGDFRSGGSGTPAVMQCTHHNPRYPFVDSDSPPFP